MEHLNEFSEFNEEKDTRYKDQYGYLEFNKEGNLRGFASGFKLPAFKKFIKEFSEANLTTGSIIIPFQGGYLPTNLPSKYIESYYWKMSKENDIKDIMALLPFKF